MAESPEEGVHLDLEATIGFCGGIPNGLKVHPDKNHLVYPIGCTVVVENLSTRKQEFLSGHSNDVSCLAMSKNGNYLASGQVTHMGFKADIIIWDFREKRMMCRLQLHMVKVEALAFSPDDKYLLSLGGEDDGSVVVWDVATGQAICGSPAQTKSAGMTHTVTFCNTCNDMFVTGGNQTLRVWKLDLPNRKIWPTECNMGQIKRVIKCIEVAEDDSFMYCGTTTGDILAVNMQSPYNFQELGPEKERFSLGVTALALLKSGELLVGAGDGSVCILSDRKKKFKRTKKLQKLRGAVTSISLRGAGHQFFVGTTQSNIYKFNFTEFTHELCGTCHSGEVKNVSFPYLCSDLYATCSFQDIRIWSAKENKELRRITVPNMTCNALEITMDGKTIVSGWDDGRIRAFYPESGKPKYTINDAHQKGVTAIALLTNNSVLISGGKEGDVRVWEVSEKLIPSKGTTTFVSDLLFYMKEHKASVTCIKVKDDVQCVTSSTDGSCIIWDLVGRCRHQMIRMNTLFKFVCYHPTIPQIITTGTDRKIAYWETSDGSMMRELEGSKSGSINGMDISSDGQYFVSGGDDKLVKVWKYDEGIVTHIGVGHGAPITCVKISPDESYIISVSNDGAILKWRFPYELHYSQNGHQ